MFTAEDIIIMTAIKAKEFKGLKEGQIPNFGALYSQSIRYKNRISVHSDPDYFPSDLYLKRAPNQTDDEFEYVKANHKAITFPVWSRFQTTIDRVWNDANWSVSSWGDIDSKFTEEQGSQKYFEEEYPNFGSLEYYFKSILTETKLRDPNAVLVHKPYEIPIKINEDGSIAIDEEGNFIIDQSQMVDPIAFIYGCESVIVFKNGEYGLFLTDEKSTVENGKNKEKTGLVFEFYDQNTIWTVRQKGRKQDYEFEAYVIWQHDLGYLPCSKLKGKPSYLKDEIIYKSPFAPACEPLDIALLDNSYLLVSKYRNAFPQKWEYITPCEYVSPDHGACEKGHILTDKGKVSCPSCKGTGAQKSGSPFQTIQVPIPDYIDGQGPKVAAPFMGYVELNPAILEFMDEQVEKNINRGLSIMNLQISNENVKGSDVALSKQIDREEMFAFLLSISHQIFGLFEFSLQTIQRMRYGNNAESPKISYPKNFSIRTESDLTEEIAEAKKEGLPDVVIRQLIFEYVNTRFSNSDRANKIVDLVFATDRIVTLSTLEIGQKIALGTVAKWEDILHTSIYMWIDDKMKNEPEFFDLEFSKQQEEMYALAKAKEIEITPAKLNPDEILAKSNAA